MLLAFPALAPTNAVAAATLRLSGAPQASPEPMTTRLPDERTRGHLF